MLIFIHILGMFEGLTECIIIAAAYKVPQKKVPNELCETMGSTDKSKIKNWRRIDNLQFTFFYGRAQKAKLKYGI